jgi:hypothetical protein
LLDSTLKPFVSDSSFNLPSVSLSSALIKFDVAVVSPRKCFIGKQQSRLLVSPGKGEINVNGKNKTDNRIYC